MGRLYLARQTTDPSVHWCRCKTYLGKMTKLTQTSITNDFKQVLTKFKQELNTLPTTWRVKSFLQFREGVTKNPKLLWKARLNLEKDSLTWLPMLAESWNRWHWLKIPPPSPEGTAGMQATTTKVFGACTENTSPPYLMAFCTHSAGGFTQY